VAVSFRRQSRQTLQSLQETDTKRILYTAMLFGTLGAGAATPTEGCTVPMSEWRPREALQKTLETEGWRVNRIKTDDGCYEVKASDDKGLVVRL
jgi:hypothetical protein